MEGNIQIDGSSIGWNGSCGVIGLGSKGSRLQIGGNAIAGRIGERLGSLACFLSSVVKEAYVARKPGFRRSFAGER
jgi:hypothetical protein